ncbi:MAG: sulfur carrier protein ThiS [Rhodospirillaceae bacterium]
MSLTVRLNGKSETIEAATVTELLMATGVDPARRGVAVAVNGEVVPRKSWPEFRLNPGADIEIVRPLQGG